MAVSIEEIAEALVLSPFWGLLSKKEKTELVYEVWTNSILNQASETVH